MASLYFPNGREGCPAQPELTKKISWASGSEKHLARKERR